MEVGKPWKTPIFHGQIIRNMMNFLFQDSCADVLSVS